MLTDEQRACIAWRCEHPKTGEDHRMVEISLGTLRTLLSAHDDAVRLRQKMDRVRMFLQWMADYEKSPPEIVKDDFAYDRLMSWMKRSCGEWASKCEAALRPAEQGGGA